MIKEVDMFLRAIGVYSYDNESEQKNTSSAFGPFDRGAIVPSKSDYGFYTPHPLSTLVKNSLPLFENKVNKPQHFNPKNGEHHYLVKMSSPTIIIGLSSKTVIHNEELRFLIRNICHLYIKGQLNTTLNDVINNTLKYTNNEIQNSKVTEIQDQLGNVKKVLIANIEKALERTDNLKVLEEKSIQLEKVGEDFYKKSKKLNSCC